DDYVLEDFLKAINGKRQYILNSRLICQQISNMDAKKRLKFAKIPHNFVLGNSCNFIAIETNLFKDAMITLDYLLIILNSFLLDWRFRLTSSNNHVNNYELAVLPIHKPSKKEKEKLSFLLEKGDRQRLEKEIINIY